MIKRLLFSLAATCAILGSTFAQGNVGELKGVVRDEKGIGIPFANVIVLKDGVQINGTSTNIDGEYTIKPIPVSTYTVVASSMGFGKKTVNGVAIQGGNRITFLDFNLVSDAIGLKEQVITFERPIIEKDQTTQGQIFEREDILKLPSRDAAGVQQLTGGASTRGGQTSLRGSRGNALVFIDGVKVRGGANLPQQSVQEVQVILGGVPAMFGDATGGITLLTTRGISNEYFGSVEVRSSKFLDNFDNYLLQGTFGGPLIRRKNDNKPIVGFLFSGEGTHSRDPNPAIRGQYKLRDEVREELINNPLRRTGLGSGTFLNADFLREEDFEKIKTRLNVAANSLNMMGKIDFNVAKNTIFTFGGNTFLQFRNGAGGGGVSTQGGGGGLATETWLNSLMNWQNNGQQRATDYNIYGKLTQRFDNPTETDGKDAAIKNAFITLQFDYSRLRILTQDPRHKDNFFNYGHIGTFQTFSRPTFEFSNDTTLNLAAFRLNNFQDTLVRFTPSPLNPEAAQYTSAIFNLFNNPDGAYRTLDDILANQGLRNGDAPGSLYSLWNNIGTPFNQYSIVDNNQFRIVGMGSADIKNHNVRIGFEFEQRNDNFYSLNPSRLWTIGRLLINRHIREIDFANPIPVFDQNGVFQDTILYNRLYSASDHSFFDKSVRAKLGLSETGTEFIDFDSYDPSFFNINMFSADELLNDGSLLVNYNGFDHTGRRLRGNTTFEDFFNRRDENGNFTREIGAFRPIYLAGYIEDKFSFKDLIFNVGVRVDRFDANQKMLRDPYSLYATRKVSEVDGALNPRGNHPGNMGDDFVVYINDNNASVPTIVGYRNGDTWFDAAGQETNSNTLNTAIGVPQPFLLNPNENVRSGNFNTDGSFTDYVPQVNVMPRVAFSFPISDEAIFTAHYDILVQRPDGNVRLNPFDYFFWDNATYNTGSRIFNNPALRPEKTIDFSLGFQQALTPKSSIKFVAYYREIRDQINVVRLEAFPRAYTTFTNIDFGTTKGLTTTYELRRFGNARLTASYTLQFAEGTGANNTSAFNLVSANLDIVRPLIPLTLDQRHQFTLFLDYSYDEGMGPLINGKHVLENAGATFTMFGGSGFPYSQQQFVTSAAAGGALGGFNKEVLVGSINGSRLPWQFNIDARFYKVLPVYFGGKEKKDGSSRKVTYVETYLQVLNLLNFENVINVYRFTGNPDNDGFLVDASTQNFINIETTDVESFRYLYALKMNDPRNFALPRRVRLGAILKF